MDILSNSWKHMQNPALKKKVKVLVETSQPDSLLAEISNTGQLVKLDLLYYYGA